MFNRIFVFDLHVHVHVGEDKQFDRRALLLYDGIHYDPLIITDSGGAILQTTFPTSNEAVLIEAVEIARQANEV